MSNVYKSWVQLSLKVFLFDKTKHYYMPYDVRKYKGFDFYWRSALSFIMLSTLTTMFAYPLDLIHTRMTADMTKKGQQRLFKTTFDCFNRTHVDEGRWGAYKGF